jgi:hypothetical protein
MLWREFMLLGGKQARCMSPLRHAIERCLGYHVVQVGLHHIHHSIIPRVLWVAKHEHCQFAC